MHRYITLIAFSLLMVCSSCKKQASTPIAITADSYQDALISEILERATYGILILDDIKDDADLKGKNFQNVFACADNLLAYYRAGYIGDDKFNEIKPNLDKIMKTLRSYPELYDGAFGEKNEIMTDLWEDKY